MKIGILLPTPLAAPSVTKSRIFAPIYPAMDLIDVLVQQGHKVTLYSAPHVETSAQLVAGNDAYIDSDLTYYQFRNRDKLEHDYTKREIIKRDFEMRLTLRAYQDAASGKLDILHSYHDYQAHYFHELTNFPTLFTLHNPLPQSTDTIEYMRYSRFTHHDYVSISDNQRHGAIKLHFKRTIHHGLDLSKYKLNKTPEDHVIYFGRLIEDKGADLAIQVAIETNTPIEIAASISKANQATQYVADKIQPHTSNPLVKMVGFFTEPAQKSTYIGRAKAFIFPLKWPEPFGLTIIEAMACGTPVIAFRCGSIPELIKDGVTGFIVDPAKGVEGLKAALSRIHEIDREECRAYVEAHFDRKQMAQKYLEVYGSMLQYSAI